MDASIAGELPDLFRFDDGRCVATVEDWRERRQELFDAIIPLEYGGLPPPAKVIAQPLHPHRVRRWNDAEYVQYRVVHADGPACHWRLDVLTPPGDGPFPTILTGDGCWRFVTDELTENILDRGFALAQFSRTEIVPDIYDSARDTGLYLTYPEHEFGALAAWAWGYHRCLDVLETLPRIDAGAVAIVGHSRGGKTVLLAGATDERIALTAPNASGAGGTGCYRWQGPESETLADSLRMIPYWYGPKLHEYIGREAELPFDQHFLKALLAPRPFLSTNGFDDLWANPSGTWQTHLAARQVYRFLGAEDRIGSWYRTGGHDHGHADWAPFLEFAAWHLQGKSPAQPFDENPYPDLPPAFSWSAPGA